MQLVVNTLTELWLAIVIFYNVETLVDGFLVFQGEDEPATQQSTTHRGYRFINNIQQTLTILLHRIDQLQRTNSKLIQSDILVLLDT